MQKKMYRSYQKSEHDSWTPIPDSNNIVEEVKALGAKKLTILSVSEPVGDDTNKSALSYKGPLYFDIDNKGDLQSAIDSTKRLVSRLVDDYQVDEGDIKVYCSGSKGMHVLVNQAVFCSGRAQKNLPQIYKAMASRLFVIGLDMGVYSGGRGNCFRIENIERYDGNYRVPVSINELNALDVDKYQSLVQQPRALVDQPAWGGVKSDRLSVIFEECKSEAGKKPKIIATTSDSDMVKIKESVPNCVMDISDWKNIAEDKNYNQVAMQLAIYIARSKLPEEVYEPIIEKVAENGSSSQYSTVKSRLEHLKGQVAYMQHSPGFGFSCGGMRSLMTRRPCDGCPINRSGEEFFDESELLGIRRSINGYFILGKEKETQISTFTLEPESIILEKPQDGGTPRRVATVVEIMKADESIGTVSFSESGWGSCSSFKKEVEGIGNIAYMGTDQHVQLIKNLVYSDLESIGEIMQVYSAGIHIEKFRGVEQVTYVEPGYSVNNHQILGTHKLQGELIAPPRFQEAEICKVGDEVADEALFHLCNICDPEDAAAIIGWFTACHFKAHLMAVHQQFPLLNIWGNAGSGKTVMTSLVSWLNGTDFMMRDTAINVTDITPYAVLEYASSTTTVPRILEEYNKSKMTDKVYTNVGEVLKASWNGETKLRGSLARKSTAGRTGATTTKIPVTGPCCYISEQSAKMPALVERSLQVMLSKKKRHGRTEHFNKAKYLREKLHSIGKYLMLKALTTKVDTVRELFDSYDSMVGYEIDDRPRYCYQTALFGIDTLRKTAEELQLGKSAEVLGKLVESYKTKIEKVCDQAYANQANTEVDAVLDTMAAMASLCASSHENYMTEGIHYLSLDDRVVIDVPLAMIMYVQFMNNVQRERPVISEPKHFIPLVMQEDYFIANEPVDGFANNRPCIILNKLAMNEKGLNANLFNVE